MPLDMSENDKSQYVILSDIDKFLSAIDTTFSYPEP